MRPIAIIIIAELFGTSLWFSANASAHGLARDWGLTSADIGLLTNAVQLGLNTFGDFRFPVQFQLIDRVPLIHDAMPR